VRVVHQRRDSNRHQRKAPYFPVHWAVIDSALAPFTAHSVLALLAAGMDAPHGAVWTTHLAPLWLRVLRRPPAGDIIATADRLTELLEAAVDAASGRPVLASRPPNDPRQHCGFTVGGRRWRVHPGDAEHPLMTLRRFATTAAAIDDEVLRAFGFTLSDVLEVVLTHGHRTLLQLAPSWPHPQPGDLHPLQMPVVDTAQVSATAAYKLSATPG
jgi:hypothetical protein